MTSVNGLNTDTTPITGSLTGAFPDGLSAIGFGNVTVNGTSPQTIALAAFNAGDIVLFGLKTVGGTVSAAGPAVLTATTGTGFTVGATASDTSVYTYLVLRPVAQA